MAETTELTIHGYPHNGIKDGRGRPKGKREPLVHLLASNGWGDVQSISFHPDDAPRVAEAIMKMATAAAAGRGRQPIKLTFESR